MATPKKGASKEIEVGDIVSKSEQFIEKHKQRIIYCIAGIAIVVAGIFGTYYGYLIPKEKQAAITIFKGEQYFARDSFALALHGNQADYPGFLSIIDDYGTSSSANLAKAYAGICYFRMGDPENALKLLKGFKGKDKMISPAVIGLIGDCHVNAGRFKEAIPYFEKAANKADNEVLGPVFLKKAGLVYEELKEYNNAVKVYTTIKEKYFNSEEAASIDKYIIRASELAKN
ncbi:MAG: tetratricopeptide repeat protein [Tannerellaceae bacterium]|jgi:tetratricopeptide (TPR) repeat protein|nr:tetratricopeptide repeat protein [Tannerellaceae bacterium]